MSQGVKRLVLDVLKPHEPNIPKLAALLVTAKSVEGVNVSLMEVDKETESVKVTIEGSDINVDHVKMALKDCGAAIHSIDEVAVGKRLVETVEV